MSHPTDKPVPAPVRKLPFFGLSPTEFDRVVGEWGWPKFRGQQVRDWVYAKLVGDPAKMSNLSPADRLVLAERVDFATAEVTRHQRSGDGTQKLLLTWPKGAVAETVMIPDGDRRTACVSSQVGCPVGCRFCASGINGVKGNLTAAQIVEQIWQLNRMLRDPEAFSREAREVAVQANVCPDDGANVEEEGAAFGEGERAEGHVQIRNESRNQSRNQSRAVPARTDRRSVRRDDGRFARDSRTFGATGPARPDSVHDSVPRAHDGPARSAPRERIERVTNIVFMGMGEPLANYGPVMQAIRILHDPKCFNLGARRITISTVGVPAKMRELSREELPLNLAISLHAPNEPLRKELIPWAEHFALDDILQAGREYFERTGREITLEYILLHGVNDRPQHARELARLCKTLRANVNLIRYNEVEGLPFLRPKGDDVVAFQDILRHNGVNAHVRKSRGRDIDAACGQLRRKQQGEQPAVVATAAAPALVPLGIPQQSSPAGA